MIRSRFPKNVIYKRTLRGDTNANNFISNKIAHRKSRGKIREFGVSLGERVSGSSQETYQDGYDAENGTFCFEGCSDSEARFREDICDGYGLFLNAVKPGVTLDCIIVLCIDVVFVHLCAM